MERTANNVVYCKVGKTNNIEKRLRIYQLHNPSISDVLIKEGDFELDILLDHSFSRMQNDSGRDNEWIKLYDLQYTCEYFIRQYDFESYYRTFINGETEESRLNKYDSEYLIDLENL